MLAIPYFVLYIYFRVNIYSQTLPQKKETPSRISFKIKSTNKLKNYILKGFISHK